jgi:hypothetical protein
MCNGIRHGSPMLSANHIVTTANTTPAPIPASAPRPARPSIDRMKGAVSVAMWHLLSS